MAHDEDRSFLTQAHLLIAGIRVFSHREGRPPSGEELAEFLKTTTELIYHMANRLEKEGVLRAVKTSFETKLYIKDAGKLRDMTEETIPDLDEEIRKNRARKLEEQEKLGALFSADAIKLREKKRMEELERKMKKGLGKTRPPWAEDE